jgi:hypothetical protein
MSQTNTLLCTCHRFSLPRITSFRLLHVPSLASAAVRAAPFRRTPRRWFVTWRHSRIRLPPAIASAATWLGAESGESSERGRGVQLPGMRRPSVPKMPSGTTKVDRPLLFQGGWLVHRISSIRAGRTCVRAVSGTVLTYRILPPPLLGVSGGVPLGVVRRIHPCLFPLLFVDHPSVGYHAPVRATSCAVL